MENFAPISYCRVLLLETVFFISFAIVTNYKHKMFTIKNLLYRACVCIFLPFVCMRLISRGSIRIIIKFIIVLKPKLSAYLFIFSKLMTLLFKNKKKINQLLSTFIWRIRIMNEKCINRYKWHLLPLLRISNVSHYDIFIF